MNLRSLRQYHDLKVLKAAVQSITVNGKKDPAVAGSFFESTFCRLFVSPVSNGWPPYRIISRMDSIRDAKPNENSVSSGNDNMPMTE